MNRISRSGAIRFVMLVAAMVCIQATTLRASEIISNVTAKAAGENTGFDRLMKWAVNGVGLAGDSHTATANGYMWQYGARPTWFRVNLNRECYVETIRVWNYNEGGGWSKRGVKIADIYTAIDPGTSAVGGAGWELVEANRVFAQAPGLNTYNTPAVITVNRTALYIGMVLITNFTGTTDSNMGLSEVQVIGRPAITLLVSNVTATASSENTTHTPRLAINAVNGSGLVGIVHDAQTTNMWQAATWPPAWYKVDLGKAYTLRRLDVWNYNELTDRGVATANIYTAMADPGTSPGGAGWTLIKANQAFTKAPGSTVVYDTPTRIILNDRARYVGFEILSSHGGSLVGFSELQFHASPPSGTFIFIR